MQPTLQYTEKIQVAAKVSLILKFYFQPIKIKNPT
jgi:hypothetical protein